MRSAIYAECQYTRDGFFGWSEQPFTNPQDQWMFLVDILDRMTAQERRGLDAKLVDRLDERIPTIQLRKKYGPTGRDVGHKNYPDVYYETEEGVSRKEWLEDRRRYKRPWSPVVGEGGEKEGAEGEGDESD